MAEAESDWHLLSWQTTARLSTPYMSRGSR